MGKLPYQLVSRISAINSMTRSPLWWPASFILQQKVWKNSPTVFGFFCLRLESLPLNRSQAAAVPPVAIYATNVFERQRAALNWRFLKENTSEEWILASFQHLLLNKKQKKHRQCPEKHVYVFQIPGVYSLGIWMFHRNWVTYRFPISDS